MMGGFVLGGCGRTVEFVMGVMVVSGFLEGGIDGVVDEGSSGGW